jgi:hypothetical protein
METKLDAGSIMLGVTDGKWSKEMFPTDRKCHCERDILFMIRGVMMVQCGKCLKDEGDRRYQEMMDRSERDFEQRLRAKRAAEERDAPRDKDGWMDGKSKAAGY